MNNNSTNPQTPPADPWAAATFEGNQREQLQRWAKMSFTQKVRWLEEMQRVSKQLRPRSPENPQTTSG